MKSKKAIALISAATMSLSLAACGGDGGSTSGSTDEIISAYNAEPQNPLVTTNTNETGGGWVINQMYRGLVRFDEDGKTVMAVADSITPNEDATKYEVKLKDDQKFSDGTPVTADSFIDAWNYGAASKNAQKMQEFYSPIKGYEEVAGEGATGDKMSGLQKKDDYNFTVELTQPDSSFLARLGSNPYFPLPKAFFDDPEGFGEHPIGNGPYKLAGDDAWQHNVKIDLVKNDDYNGEDAAKNAGVTFKLYTSLETAYTDMQAGNLDIIGPSLPSSAFATFRDDFPDSHTEQPVATFYSFTIPQWQEHFGPDPEGGLRRKAISMAINRELLIDKIFNNTKVQATDFGAPTLDISQDVPGNDVLKYNPEKAKELWAKADAISPYSGEFQIAYNADGGHKEWVEAITNDISKTLGIKASGKAYPVFKALRDDVTNKSIQTAFRSGWQGDFPSIHNFLEPIYMTGASSNDGDYSNPEFDKLLEEASAEPDKDKANQKYIDAEAVLMEDLPAIPLYYGTASTAWNPAVKDVKFQWNGEPDFVNMKKG